jgi:hypothetical protein
MIYAKVDGAHVLIWLAIRARPKRKGAIVEIKGEGFTLGRCVGIHGPATAFGEPAVVYRYELAP